MVRKWDLNCEVAYMCLQVVLQLQNNFQNFRKLILQADFAVAKFSLSLVRLSSNGHKFFVSDLIHTLFKALDSDFSSFETIYSMYKMDSMKCSKCVLQLLPS